MRNKDVIHNDGSLQQFVIVRLDRTIQCPLDSPIKSGNDGIVFIYDVVYNCDEDSNYGYKLSLIALKIAERLQK
jgi:hypothetical protein